MPLVGHDVILRGRCQPPPEFVLIGPYDSRNCAFSRSLRTWSMGKT